MPQTVSLQVKFKLSNSHQFREYETLVEVTSFHLHEGEYKTDTNSTLSLNVLFVSDY